MISFPYSLKLLNLVVRNNAFIILNTVEVGFSERFDQQIIVTKSWVVD